MTDPNVLLREARNYLSTWAICNDGNRCKEIVDRIDAFLSHPEPTLREPGQDDEEVTV